MSKILFTLISRETVHMPPGQKVVPASEFSTLKEAHDLLLQAKAEKEELRTQAEAEAKNIKEQAVQEGFQEGLKALNAHILTLDQQLKELRQEVQKTILPLTLKAARKILGEELKLHPERIVDIVITALKPVTQHKRVIIYAHRADLEVLEQHKPEIKKIFDHLETFSLQERSDIEPGGCIIETEAGIINAQLENQWRALEAAFEAFMKK
jgi:type III secretion protein L